MQTALITYLPTAPNGNEPSGEAVPAGYKATGHQMANHQMTSQGMKISSALQSQKNDTLFTTILKKGITIDTALGLSAGELQLMTDTNADTETDGETPADVGGLLMQLMVMNSAGQVESGDMSRKAEDENALNGVLSVINELPDVSAGTLKGLENAATVILQNEGRAAEALSALAASKTAAENDSRSAGQPGANPSPVTFETVVAGITGALKNELSQQAAPQNAQTEITGTAAGAAENNIGPEMPVSAATYAENPGSQTENGELQTKGRPEEVLVKDLSAITEASHNEKSGVSTAGGNSGGDGGGSTDGDGGGSTSGLAFREKRKDIGVSPAENGLNGAAPDTGVRSGAAAEKTFAVERALNRFADDITSVRAGSQEIRIVLEPESMGVLTISVIKTESGISAKIKSEDRELAAIISDHVHKLISSIESKGITVNDVDVTYSQTEQNTGFSQNGFTQAREESSKRSPLPPEKASGDEASAEVWQTLYDAETGGDIRVDYRV